jgi:hypothetical protein
MLPLVDATPRDPIGPWAWDTIPYFVHCSNATGTHATHVQFVRHTTHTLSFGLVLTSSISRQWAKCSNTAGTVPASILPSCRRIRRVLAARCGGGVVGVFAEMTARARLSHNLVTRTNDACTAVHAPSVLSHYGTHDIMQPLVTTHINQVRSTKQSLPFIVVRMARALTCYRSIHTSDSHRSRSTQRGDGGAHGARSIHRASNRAVRRLCPESHWR